jgi:hypothetical protein
MPTLRFAAATLVISLIASPMVLDACLVNCHASTTVDKVGAEPACHHTNDNDEVRLEAPATVCGHDHSSSPLTLTSSARDAGAKADAAVLVADSTGAVLSARLECGVANASRLALPRCRTDIPHLRI